MEALTPEQYLDKYFDERTEEFDISEELQKLKGSADKISEEEKEKRRKELEEISSEELGKIFGLD